MDNSSFLENEEKGKATVIKQMIERYDTLLYDQIVDEYYGQSGFANLGYWDETTQDAREACRNLVEKLLDMLPGTGGNILDVACGKGGTTHHLLNHYRPGKLIGVNISEKQIESARSRAPDSAFAVMDAANLAFNRDSFDTILCVEAAFHFFTREAFFREAFRILKPGGCLIMSDVLMKEGVEGKLSSFYAENYIPTPMEYEKLCRRAGFSEIRLVDATGPCWEGHYWNVIRYGHDRYLHGRIDRKTMMASLESTYRIVGNLNCYLLVFLGKGQRSEG